MKKDFKTNAEILEGMGSETTDGLIIEVQDYFESIGLDPDEYMNNKPFPYYPKPYKYDGK